MKRLLRTVAALVSTMMLLPASAFAYQDQLTPLGLHIAVSATGLVVAMVLLFEALGLRKVALGGAIAEKLYYVVLAIVCLASSALAKWVGNFVSGIQFEQTELASELLVLVGMALLASYFYSVRTAMQAFLKGMKAEQDVRTSAKTEESEGEPVG